METFFDYCKQYIVDHINEYEGQEVYGADFCHTITDEPNQNGTLTFSSQEAREYIRQWWDEAGEYWQYEKDNFGKHYHNPFDKPEAYMVCMVIEGCSSILSQCQTIEDNWNDEIELTADVIDTILQELEDITEIRW